jgi:hypothetical protein
MDVVLKERKVKLSRITSEHKHKIASTHQYHNKVEDQSINYVIGSVQFILA